MNQPSEIQIQARVTIEGLRGMAQICVVEGHRDYHRELMNLIDRVTTIAYVVEKKQQNKKDA